MNFEILLSIFLGIGLAAACGFRVFLPLFIASLFTHFNVGGMGLGGSFEWLGQLPALIAFGVASIVEVFAYFLPFLDNLLDTVAVPLAAVAGTFLSLAAMVDISPLFQWSIALIAGGGLAGLIKGTAAGARLASSTTTAGIGNPLISAVETGTSIFMAVLAWFIPLFATALVLLLLFWVFRWWLRSN